MNIVSNGMREASTSFCKFDCSFRRATRIPGKIQTVFALDSAIKMASVAAFKDLGALRKNQQ